MQNTKKFRKSQWEFSQSLGNNKPKPELCDYGDPDFIKHCPPAIPPMITDPQANGMGPQMDNALLQKCLDDPTDPECQALGAYGDVTRSPSTYTDTMPTGGSRGEGGLDLGPDGSDCFGNMYAFL